LLQKDLKATSIALDRERNSVKDLQEELKEYADVEAMIREVVGLRDRIRELKKREWLISKLNELRTRRDNFGRYDSIDVCSDVVSSWLKPKVRMLAVCKELMWVRSRVFKLNAVDGIGIVLSECGRKAKVVYSLLTLKTWKDSVPVGISGVTVYVDALKSSANRCWHVNRLALLKADAVKSQTIDDWNRGKLKKSVERRDLLRGDIKECPLCGRSG
jgi:hypothetical protein